MLAQLKTVGLIKEAIKLAFFRLVEYLEHQHLWVPLQAQNGERQNIYSLFLLEAGRCECICMHSEANTFGGWPGVKKGSK